MRKENKLMNTWGSVITQYRKFNDSIADACNEIEKTGISTQNRQVGNIANDLHELKEFDLIEQLHEAIAAYNAEAERKNAEFNEWKSFLSMLKRQKWSSSKRKAFLREMAKQDLRDIFEDNQCDAWKSERYIDCEFQEWS